MPKPKIVAICGAGLSADIGMPTMAQWAHSVHYHPSLTIQELEDFRQIQITCNAILGQIGGSASNLEDLSSVLEMLDLTEPDFKFPNCVQFVSPSDAIHLLREIIVRVYAPPAEGDYTNALQLIASLEHSASSLTVVTTNYDLNIELGAAYAGFKVSLPVQGAIMASSGAPASELCTSMFDNRLCEHRKDPPPEFQLCKLHGSVNWVERDGVLRIDDRVRPVQQSGQPRPDYRYFADQSARSPASDTRIVAPSAMKGQGFAILADQWRAAASALSSADQLWIVGYSFPASDALMRYFVATSLRGNTTLRRIIIVDPNGEDVLGRTNDLFGPPVFSGRVEVVPINWTRLGSAITDIAMGRWNPKPTDALLRQIAEGQEARRILDGAGGSAVATSGRPSHYRNRRSPL